MSNILLAKNTVFLHMLQNNQGVQKLANAVG